MLDIFIFSIFYLLLISVIGYGFLFQNIFQKNKNLEIKNNLYRLLWTVFIDIYIDILSFFFLIILYINTPFFGIVFLIIQIENKKNF